VIFLRSGLRRKRANGKNVCNAFPRPSFAPRNDPETRIVCDALRRGADAGKLCDHSRSKNGVASLAYVPVNGTRRIKNNERGRHG
jgi:hypothetical protein